MVRKSRFNRHLIENRQVRVFLSSTFSDMQDERNALVKTFNMLKVEAAKRNVAFSVVDLRWGVTPEEAKAGKVISVCLDEIEKSHPFFVGILGNNYGTAPDRSLFQINPELLEHHPWLNKAVSNKKEESMSITEMEIQYGVLSKRAEIDAAFFFRKGNKPDNDKRLTDLKDKIRKKYKPQEYTSPSELCDLVAAEIWKIIDKHFPEKNPVTPLDRERTAQRAYINSWHSCYLPRPRYNRMINTFVRSDKQHLVLFGDSGIGKSALLANWIKRNERNPGFNLVYHFVGNLFSGNSYMGVLRHLCDEICDLYGIEKKDGKDEDIVEEARRLVSEVSCHEKPLVIVMDGINQITAPNDKKSLLWLPPANKKVKFIFSTLPDDETMDTFKHRKYKRKEVKPLGEEERRKWIPRYLMRVGKKLDEGRNQLERIAKDPECENTLVLRTLLDELTCFGLYEKIDERIDYYLSASTIPDFFDRVLKRMEDDYSAGQDLVRHALTLLAVSEHGLSEDELLDLLGCNKHPLEWKLFFCAFYNNFVERNGLIQFSHSYIEDAVASRYKVGDIKSTEPFRREIISYFSSREIENRSISELAFQYYNVSDWDNLFGVLKNFAAFRYFDSANQYMLRLYWEKLLEVDEEKYPLKAYLQLPAAKDAELALTYNCIALFIQEVLADYDIALEYFQKALEVGKKVLGKKDPEIATFYCNIGNVLDHESEYDLALKHYDKALRLLESLFGAEHPETFTIYNNIGEVHRVTSNFKKAKEYHETALKISVNCYGTEHPATALSYNNLGLVYHGLGKYREALDLHLKSLEIHENILGENHPDTATSYMNAGTDYVEIGDLPHATEFYLKDLAINKVVLGETHPNTADSYNNIGELYRNNGQYDKARSYHQKALKVRLKVFGKKNHNVAQSYNNLGLVYLGKNNFRKSLLNLTEALNIWLEVFGKYNQHVALCYDNLASLYDNKGKHVQACYNYLNAMEIQERILEMDHPDLALTYNNLGVALHKLGEKNNALHYLQKAYDIFKVKLGKNHPSTLSALNWMKIVKGGS